MPVKILQPGEARPKVVGIDFEKGVRLAKESGLSIDQIRTELIGAYSKHLLGMKDVYIVGQKLSGIDPNLAGVSRIVEVFSDPSSPIDPDRGYETFFKEINMRQATETSFGLLDIKGGITFYQQKEGQEVKMSKSATTSKAYVERSRFSGGIVILDDYIRYNQFYKIEAIFDEATIGWFDQKATLHYGMLAALSGGILMAWDTDLSTTINNACNQLIEKNKTKSAIKGNKRFVLVIPEGARFKVAKALAASFQNANTNINEIVYPIQNVVPTTYLPVATHMYVGIAGGKNQKGEWEDFNARPAQRDETKLGATNVWTGAYGSIIGDEEQWVRIPLSA